MHLFWIILMLLTKNSEEAIAGIILIHTKVAIANAYEVAIIGKSNIKKTTKAMFLNLDGDVQYFTVTGYTLHPEFDEDTLNSLALLKLEYDQKKFPWDLMDWPKEWSLMNENKGDVYVLGYTDRHNVLEQVMHKMEFVNKSDCHSFYKNEELDSKWMAPTDFECYRKKYNSEQCVFESGMALAAFSAGRWTLLGMSVLGPGCSLPARFIDFARFVPWVEVETKATRRYYPETNIYYPNYDQLILQKINDTRLVMRPYKGTEVIYGKCNPIDGELMYHETDTFETPGQGIGIYGLSLFDEYYEKITCAQLTVNCTKRSTKPFRYDIGLVQYHEDLNALIKSIPITQGGQTIGPKIVHLQEGPWVNWWHRKPPDETKSSSVVFKFEFYKQARLDIIFYGIPAPAPAEDDHQEEDEDQEASTKADNATRSRRPHSEHIRGKTTNGTLPTTPPRT